MIPVDRPTRLAWAIYERENERAAREYRDHPTACARWCIECVRPCGTTKNCEHCADTRATRRRRARSKP